MFDENISIQETFLGSNGIYYTHIYYLAYITTPRVPIVNPENISQAGEVESLHWFNFKEAVNSFRVYEHTKRSVIYKARKTINEINHKIINCF